MRIYASRGLNLCVHEGAQRRPSVLLSEPISLHSCKPYVHKVGKRSAGMGVGLGQALTFASFGDGLPLGEEVVAVEVLIKDAVLGALRRRGLPSARALAGRAPTEA